MTDAGGGDVLRSGVRAEQSHSALSAVQRASGAGAWETGCRAPAHRGQLAHGSSPGTHRTLLPKQLFRNQTFFASFSIRDPNFCCSSRIRIPDPGVKKAPDPDPQHCFLFWICIRILGYMNQKANCFRLPYLKWFGMRYLYKKILVIYSNCH